MTSPAAIASKSLALACAAAFCYALRFYPFERTWLAPILLLYLALLCWRQHWWLGALPALLPALDLAPWTGWIYFEEIDLLLLLTATFGYWRLADTPPQARLPGFAAICIGAVTLAHLIGAAKGMLPLPALDGNAFTSYLSPYNGLRAGKAWFWAVLLLPLLLRAAGPNLAHLRSHLLPGMLAGLAAVAGAALWERALFPGLLNFSSDYRTSAPFSGMHTGGAALDGYLALSLPFVAGWLLTPQPRPKTAAALALLALGAYAGLTTFSRGLFAGLSCSALLLALFPLARPLRRRVLDWRRGALGAALALLCALALARMFAGAGYRGLAAAFAVLAAAMLLATLPLPRRLLPAAFVCASAAAPLLAGLLGAAALPAGGLFSPPYLMFLLSALVFGAAYLRLRPRRSVALAPPAGAASAALIGFTCLGYSALWVGWHWAGAAALAPGALVAALALLLIVVNTSVRRPLWRADRAGVTAGIAAAVLLLLAIPVGASYYAGERFATSAGDLRHRLRHWNGVLAMMDDGIPTQLFGMGLGRFPLTYFWRNPQRELPATVNYVDEAGNRYVRLAAPQYPLGYGEVLRLLQRLALQPHTRYRLALDVRRAGAMPQLRVAVCERQLLYPQNCVAAPLRLRPGDADWHHYQVAFDSAALGHAGWSRGAPLQIEIAADGPHGALDIDNLSLRDEAGHAELINNGSFTDANNYWFFSSDRHHLPWHVKNFALNLYFELGWLGLLSMLSLLACALARLAPQAWRGGAQAAYHLAALAGFLVVGVFDSLLDVPRVSLLFFLVLFCAIALPAGSAPLKKGAAP
ncbi:MULTISPECIES: hypothetical protein [unclassified Janthinobacterium]|uniref:hypothetical protein n=1 Tax=unclassified Janthinobacterium TaxID=2610881 RepID=UPI000349F8A9|nr:MULTISPECIES: hypothetical protein [unclassified Janthinobacterium]MEC5161318.1 hypothetical protein [Janthinobacterium sp. CG_S6]